MRTNIKVKLELFYKNRAHLGVKQRKAHCCYQKEQHAVGKRKKTRLKACTPSEIWTLPLDFTVTLCLLHFYSMYLKSNFCHQN